MDYRTADEHLHLMSSKWAENLETWNLLFDKLAPQSTNRYAWEGVNPWYCLWCMMPTRVADGSNLFGVCRECGRLAAFNVRDSFVLETRKLHPGFSPLAAFAGSYDMATYVERILKRQQFVLEVVGLLHSGVTLARWHDSPMQQLILLPAKLFHSPDRHYIRARANRAWWDARFCRLGEGGLSSSGRDGQQYWTRLSSYFGMDPERQALFLDTLSRLTSESVCLDEERAECLREELREAEWFDKGRTKWIACLGADRTTEDVEIWDALWNLATKRVGYRGKITATGAVEFPFVEARSAVTVKDIAAICQEFQIEPGSLTFSLVG